MVTLDVAAAGGLEDADGSLLVAFAVGPLVAAGITFAISAARGNAPSRRLAPMLVAACGMTALLWGVVFVVIT